MTKKKITIIKQKSYTTISQLHEFEVLLLLLFTGRFLDNNNLIYRYIRMVAESF